MILWEIYIINSILLISQSLSIEPSLMQCPPKRKLKKNTNKVKINNNINKRKTTKMILNSCVSCSVPFIKTASLASVHCIISWCSGSRTLNLVHHQFWNPTDIFFRYPSIAGVMEIMCLWFHSISTFTQSSRSQTGLMLGCAYSVS